MSALLGGCPHPCKMTEYDLKLTTTPRLPPPLESPEYTQLLVYFDSTTVQVNSEALVYNLLQLLAAAGGTIGMYLGISLLSVTSGAVEWLWGRFSWRKRSDKTNSGKEVTSVIY